MRTLILIGMFVSILAAQTPAPTTGAPAGNVENGKKLYMERGCFQCVLLRQRF